MARGTDNCEGPTEIAINSQFWLAVLQRLRDGIGK